MAEVFGSHCATIRPKNGISNKILSEFMKYAKKQDYALIVSEKKDEERHLHMIFWFNDPRELGATRRAMERIQSKHDPNWDAASKNVCRKGVNHAYNDDYMNNYLTVDKDGHEIVYKNIPADTSKYYPSKEYQEKAISISQAADKKFCKLSLEFLEWKPKDQKIDIELVAKYLAWRMFTARNMYVLTSRKAKIELAENLYWYTVGGESATAIDAFIDDGRKKTSPIFDSATCHNCHAPIEGCGTHIYTGYDCLGRSFSTNCGVCANRWQSKD